MKYVVLLFGLFLALSCLAQQELKGIIADSATRQPLSFATVQAERRSVISGIGGAFSISLPASTKEITVSYVGHQTLIVALAGLKKGDTIFLAPATEIMNEVIVRSQANEIRRIVNTAIRNKPQNNPELYSQFQCYVYYKMSADLLPYGPQPTDSARKAARQAQEAKAHKRKPADTTKKEEQTDTLYSPDHSHLMFSESYSVRRYRRPQQYQETVLASRFSGLKKTYFTNLITDILPFHVYTDYISLNGKDYMNPIAKGWQTRYDFFIEDELTLGKDTVFLLSFRPKPKAVFNSLSGLVYINSNGYAITHFVGETDTTIDRTIHFEQIYHLVNGKWFPQELNYVLSFKGLFTPYLQFIWNGHSIIDSVSFNPDHYRFDKAHTVKLDDSVDKRSPADWERFRATPITEKEANTYTLIDSLFEKAHIEKIITGMSRLAMGRFPIGKFDLDINHLIAINRYEGWRLGAGFFTNDSISRTISLGAWAGYGTRDKEWKYGGSATVYFNRRKENMFTLAYNKDYRNPGEVLIHPELAATGLRYWSIGLVDLYEQYSAKLYLRKDYWEFKPEWIMENVKPLYFPPFFFDGKELTQFDNQEGGIVFRYAYGERREPLFDYYLPAGTKYPIAYLKASKGRITSDGYENNYWRLLTAFTWQHHINRWGIDHFRLEGGMIQSQNSLPIPRSFLLAGNGFKLPGINYYSTGGFMTFHPFDYYNDQYAAFFYRHEFDRYLWKTSWSKPSINLAHNMGFGHLSQLSKLNNGGLRSFGNGYHESGIMLMHLLRTDFHFADFNINGGYFYHWANGFSGKNGTWVVGFSASF